MSELKLQKLKTILLGYKSVVIAFSGGTDSTFLLHTASLIKDLKVIGVTIKTQYIPEWEIREATDFCRSAGIPHKILTLPFPEIIRNNPLDRCYQCKKSLFSNIRAFASENNYDIVADGTNSDDMGDYRPGLKALSELSIESPLKEAGLSKNEIRELSEKAGLPTWNKPPYACLLTRIPYNTPISDEIPGRIEEAEVFIREAGFSGCRVRVNGEEARIECNPEQIEKMAEKQVREKIVNKLHTIGFRFVSVDLEGYRMGSFNPQNKQL